MTSIQLPHVETDCTIQHEGRAFTAGGAVITETRLVAYPMSSGILVDWHGNAIGTWHTISSRPAVFFGYQSFMSSRYFYMRATVNGREYSLHGFGEGCVAFGRALKPRKSGTALAK